jgi:two-component system, sensor histidine kinase PdtaS
VRAATSLDLGSQIEGRGAVMIAGAVTALVWRGTRDAATELAAVERFLASLPDRPQPILIRVSFTLLIMGLSALVQIGIFHLTGFTGFFLLLPGIFACGLIFDRGSAFLATIIGLVLALYVTPSLARSPQEVVPLLLFAITGFAVAFVSEAMRSVMERLIKAERTKDVLLRELDHRAKNNMMSMASLLRLQSRAAANCEAKEALRSSASRIQVMANVHDHLAPSSPDRSVKMKEYLEQLCQNIEEMRAISGIIIRSQTDETILPEKQALPLAFIVNELVTNCLKYAFPDSRYGIVEVALRSDGDVVLNVSDNGIGRGDDAKPGVGSRLIDVMVQQLGATIRYEDANPGCRATVRIHSARLVKVEDAPPTSF